MQRTVNPLYVNIGARISSLRHKRKLTQAQLSEQLDITVKHLSESERGLTSLSLEKLVLLCTILDTDMEYLIRGNDITKHSVDIPDYIMSILQSDDARQKKILLDYFLMYKRIRDS